MHNTTALEIEACLEQARMLVSRLERLSADSIWAHRASGVRGALWRSIDILSTLSTEQPEELAQELNRLKLASTWGYTALENAARELLE